MAFSLSAATAFVWLALSTSHMATLPHLVMSGRKMSQIQQTLSWHSHLFIFHLLSFISMTSLNYFLPLPNWTVSVLPSLLPSLALPFRIFSSQLSKVVIPTHFLHRILFDCTQQARHKDNSVVSTRTHMSRIPSLYGWWDEWVTRILLLTIAWGVGGKARQGRGPSSQTLTRTKGGTRST